jgi:periplasmic divalent cation tolerance protein
MTSNFCQLWLTCTNKEEADKISETLLAKHLVACVRQTPVISNFHWQGKTESANEAMLLMESSLDLFDEVEKEIAQAHSYDTFVLEAVPVAKVSKKAEKWLKAELKNG